MSNDERKRKVFALSKGGFSSFGFLDLTTMLGPVLGGPGSELEVIDLDDDDYFEESE